MEALAGTYVFLVVFLFIIGILWILMPFAIFGTKARLDRLIAAQEKANLALEKASLDGQKLVEEQQRTNALLEYILAQGKAPLDNAPKPSGRHISFEHPESGK